MRKYDIKNKRNIGIIIVISVIIIIMFSLVISLFLRTDKKEYTVYSNTLVFDKDKTIIKLEENGIIKTKWNNDYYLIYNDEDYELGNTAIAYREDTGEIYLYGRYYEISTSDEINVTNDETVIKNSALTKFYKLADRKYLVIDREIKSSDGLLSTTDFLMIDLDRVGNATLTNHKVSLKTFSETVIVTSNYTFDIANEVLTYGNEKIDLKKIIGSSNTYLKEDLVPEENFDNDGVTNITDNIGGANNSGNGDSSEKSESDSNTIIEEIKKASKKTSIVLINTTISEIKIDYVVYDPYKEYTSVYMEVSRRGSNVIDTVHLNPNETSYVISNDVFPNTDYNIKFKCTYMDSETSMEVRETIDDVIVTTKLPDVSIKVNSTEFENVIKYQITSDYNITSGRLIFYVDDEEVLSKNITINGVGNTFGEETILENINNKEIKLELVDIMSDNLLIEDLSTSYMFKY